MESQGTVEAQANGVVIFSISAVEWSTRRALVRVVLDPREKLGLFPRGGDRDTIG